MWDFFSALLKLFLDIKVRFIKGFVIAYLLVGLIGTGLCTFLPGLTIFQCVTITLYVALCSAIMGVSFAVAIFNSFGDEDKADSISFLSLLNTVCLTLLYMILFVIAYDEKQYSTIKDYVFEMVLLYLFFAIGSFLLAGLAWLTNRLVKSLRAKKAANDQVQKVAQK